MISIIICSRTPDISQELKQNIATTIGCDYELVVVDNSSNGHSIFSAYNEGIRRSKGELLCFCHEDVLFITQDWGEIICENFQLGEDIGLIGFGGAHFLPDTPLYWSASPLISEYCYHSGMTKCFHIDYFKDNHLAEVLAVDGFCFFTPRMVFDQVSFDETTYQGFHLYDMDLCFQIRENGFRVFVCNNIEIEHFWNDNPAKPGMSLLDVNLDIFVKKWNGNLPVHVGIDTIPEYVYERLNNLCKQAYDAKLARRSKSYRLGRFLLSPLSVFKRK